MKNQLIFLIAIITIHFKIYATPAPGEEYIYVEPQSRYDNGYPETRYHFIIEKFKEIFSPIINEQGGTLIVFSDWTDGAVNMWAGRIENEYRLEIPGGFSRFYLINEDAFILTICHELGHLLGGEPSSYDISFEGQADYYSSFKCAERVFPQIEPYKSRQDNIEVDKACANRKTPTDSETCKRTLLGALSATSYYAEIANVAFPQLSKRDPSRVDKTIEKHLEFISSEI